MSFLWDAYQSSQISQLNSRIDRLQDAGAHEQAALQVAAGLEEKVDRLAPRGHSVLGGCGINRSRHKISKSSRNTALVSGFSGSPCDHSAAADATTRLAPIRFHSPMASPTERPA